MHARRLESGGRIDRSKPLRFEFDGRQLTGFAGDTLASALLANDVRLVGRSFKLRRPRGIVGCGSEEPNAILQVGAGVQAQPNLKATEVELTDGLRAHTTKGWPSVSLDLGAVNGVFARVLSPGFYYKTFMQPRALWRWYERFIRSAAGYGSTPDGPDPALYAHRNAHCDVLVVGAGPAGLMAALTAARSGARVILADEQNEFGGRLLSSTQRVGGLPAAEWVGKVVTELADCADVTLLSRGTVFGYFDHNFLTIAERCADHLAEPLPGVIRQREWRVRARQVVLAQGAFERPMVFCNNDRPGVMLASAISTYVNRYAVCPGGRAVVFTNNDSAYQAALDLHSAGADVTVVDSRPGGAGVLGERVEARGMDVLRGHIVTNVVGRGRIKAVRIAAWRGDSSATVNESFRAECDLLAMSGGWSPAVHLHSQAGGRIRWDDSLLGFLPDVPVQACFSAGSGNGRFSLAGCLEDGIRAGRAAAAACSLEVPELEAPQVDDSPAHAPEPLWRVPAARDPDRCAKQFLDFQNDTCVADVRQAVREGYRNVEHVKRYTALGFGTDQGRLGNINGMAVLAECLGEPIPAVGTTTFRPSYTPVALGVCAGEGVGALYEPIRKTAIHEWHEEAGAPMEIVGQWHRPRYFPRTGEDMRAAVARECLATRRSLGIMDASTLGKIDVRGPDAVAFLERLYTHDAGKMATGRCAYGILLGEDGMLKDDGVMTRLGEQHFYLTTTTGGAAPVLAWLESWLQTEWPDLEVYLTSLTEHFATISLAGPNSRALLEKVGCSIEPGAAEFPFMSTRCAELASCPVQLFRVSFSGELAFEINVDSGLALDLWERLMEAGEEFDITPYGTETMHVLRAEKGYAIVGQDTDGSVNPVDLGMNWMLSPRKDYIGRRSLQRMDSRRPERKQLVGLRSADGATVLPEGTQLLDRPATKLPAPMCGHVTSSYDSACLGHPIALALVSAGRTRLGETIHAALPGRKPFPVTIVSPVFYDPDGKRQRA